MNNSTPTFPDNIIDYAPWVTKHGLLQPYGMCQCGCGKPVKIASKSHTRMGHKRGEPFRYIYGHHKRMNLESVESRFWRKVEKYGPLYPELSTRCWVWTASTEDYGYGQFWTGERRTQAHRYSYEIHNGSIPDGMFVCHSCDRPECVNPDHLFLGTPKDNTADMIAKGRKIVGSVRRGEDNAAAKLSNAEVVSIRERLDNGESTAALAEEYHVSIATIQHIKSRLSWKHI